MIREPTTTNQSRSQRRDLAAYAPSPDLASNRYRWRSVSSNNDPSIADWWVELDRSRNWPTRRATRIMSLSEMWERSSGIFMCILLMVLIVVTMIIDYQHGTLFTLNPHGE